MPKTIGGLIEDVFQNGFQRVFGDEAWGDGITVPVNILDAADAFELHLMAPGLEKENFRVNVDRNVLHISYEQQDQKEEKDLTHKWLRKEYKLQTFRRSFTLTDKINISGISAKYVDGVMIVTLPKKETTEPNNQEIKVD